MAQTSRRQFLSESALLATATAALGTIPVFGQDKKPPPAPKKVAPSERLRVAVIGYNSRGMDHIKSFAALPETEVTVLCDCDANLEGKGKKLAESIQGSVPTFVQDLRRVMDDKNIDIVSIATPNHWHALAAIWAIQAGKDVYVEKPVSHNVYEGRQIVNHARRHKRIVQTGTQSRSNPGMREAIAFIHGGGIGEVKRAKGLCYKFRPTIGERTTREVPQGVDYNLWCGPGPLSPLSRPKFHYDWHWFWDFGNGDLGNQGIHEMDKARWGLGVDALCNSVFSLGGRLGYVDCGETANTQISRFEFGDKELIFEVRGLATTDPFGQNRGKNFVGNIWYGSEGMVVSGSYDSAVATRPDGEVIKKFKGGANHAANFVKAVKSRQHTDLNADIEEGHLSSALCHLANISYRLGSRHPITELDQIVTASSLTPELERLREHLKDNKLALDEKLQVQCGLTLFMDPKTERFTCCDEANGWLARDYRAGFEVRPAVA